MRALIVGATSREPELVAQLASACDLIIAADAGGTAILAARRLPDLVIGDLDSLASEVRAELSDAGVRFITAPADKDVTDLDLAIAEALRRGATEIWATGVLGERLDHTLASLGSLARCAAARPRVLEPDVAAWILAPEGRARLELEPAGALVSLFAHGAPATVSCGGMRYPLHRETLRELDSRGLSNVIEGPAAFVEVLSGLLFVLSVLTNGTLLARESETMLHPE